VLKVHHDILLTQKRFDANKVKALSEVFEYGWKKIGHNERETLRTEIVGD
jgi:hypothetical protein